MSTVSAVEESPSLSVTTSEKVRVSPEGPTDGAVKAGCEDVTSDSVTEVPAVWSHANVMVPSLSMPSPPVFDIVMVPDVLSMVKP